MMQAPINGTLLRYVARRYALPCALCAVLPILVGLVLGSLWPDYKLQVKALSGILRFAEGLLRIDLLAPDSIGFYFQIPLVHPISMLGLILATTMPTLALPATARGRGALDLLLATGLTRRELVATSSLFAVPFAALLAAAPVFGSWLGALVSHVADELPMTALFRVAFEAFLLGLFFAGLGQLLSVLAADLFGASKWLVAIILWSLAAEVVGTSWPKAHFLKFTSPFGYYEPAQVIAGVASYGRDCSILAGGALVCFVAALWFEERRKSA